VQNKKRWLKQTMNLERTKVKEILLKKIISFWGHGEGCSFQFWHCFLVTSEQLGKRLREKAGKQMKLKLRILTGTTIVKNCSIYTVQDK
jgi:hypothetical protein